MIKIFTGCKYDEEVRPQYANGHPCDGSNLYGTGQA